jgi:hypothetical protein
LYETNTKQKRQRFISIKLNETHKNRMKPNKIIEEIERLNELVLKDEQQDDNEVQMERNGHYEQYLIKIFKKEPIFSQAEESSLIHPEGLQYYYNTFGRFIVDVPGVVYFYGWENFNPSISGWALIDNFNDLNREWLSLKLAETTAMRELNHQLRMMAESDSKVLIKEPVGNRNKIRMERINRNKNPESVGNTTQPYKKKSNSLEEVISTKSKLTKLGVLSSYSIKDRLIGNAIDYELTDLRKRLEKIARRDCNNANSDDYDDSESEEK